MYDKMLQKHFNNFIWHINESMCNPRCNLLHISNILGKYNFQDTEGFIDLVLFPFYYYRYRDTFAVMLELRASK